MAHIKAFVLTHYGTQQNSSRTVSAQPKIYNDGLHSYFAGLMVST